MSVLAYDAPLLDAQVELAWAQERRLLEQLGLAGHVLDAGCGNGALTMRLTSLADVTRVTGVDRDETLLATARERCPDATLLAGDVTRLPLEDDSVDGAIVRLVLQHVPDPAAVVAELVRVVRPGGLVVAIEVDGGMWGVCEPYDEQLARVQRRLWTRRGGAGPDRMIGRRLPRILAAGGARDVELHPYAYHSDDLGVDAFGPLLAPDALLASAEAGSLSITEAAQLAAGFERFRADPDAFVLLLGMLCAGRA